VSRGIENIFRGAGNGHNAVGGRRGEADRERDVWGSLGTENKVRLDVESAKAPEKN
jgi:hypothetical protein